MLTNDKERRICAKYSERKNNRVNCCQCPLVKGDPRHYDFRCKANSHYDRHTKEWEYDNIQIHEIKEVIVQ